MKKYARKGLNIPSPELFGEAMVDTIRQINRVLIAYVTVVLFCVLALRGPHSGLFDVKRTLDVPFAGKMPYGVFLFIGPSMLIILRIYLQIYVEHETRLEKIASYIKRRARMPTIIPSRNPVLRMFFDLVLYISLPLAMFSFYWETSVFYVAGLSFCALLTSTTMLHVLLPARGVSWTTKTSLAFGTGIFASFLFSNSIIPRQYLHLENAKLSSRYLGSQNFSHAYLMGADFHGSFLPSSQFIEANLTNANLAHADLVKANFEGATIRHAIFSRANLFMAELKRVRGRAVNLQKADLQGAMLQKADLRNADLQGAMLQGANLQSAQLDGAFLVGTDLQHADLAGATLNASDLRSVLVTQKQLNHACGSGAALPKGLVLNPC